MDRAMRRSSERGGKANGRNGASLRQRVYVLLKAMIEDGRLGAGERLLEAQVAKAFGVSRSPARGALRALCRDGFVAESSGRGYRISGSAESAHEGRLASLDTVRITAPPQWERMYRELEQEIAARTLFGPVRVSDQKLADHFGVSRTVTRDVLARMHGVGLIRKDRSGHWFAEHVTPERVGHLYEMRWLLEPQALLQAAPHVSDAELERARRNVHLALETSPVESAAFDRAEGDLHKALLSQCPNQEILYALERTHSLFVPTRHLSDPFLGIPMDLIEAALEEHLGILDQLLDRKPERAAELLAQHLKVAHARWLRRFEITTQMTALTYPSYLSRA